MRVNIFVVWCCLYGSMFICCVSSAYTCNSWSRQLDILFMFPEAVSTWSALSSRWLHGWNIALNESHCASKDKFSRYFSSNWGMQIQYWILWMNIYVILSYVQKFSIYMYIEYRSITVTHTHIYIYTYKYTYKLHI